MEREKIIELARNLGWEYDEEDGHIYYDGTPITTMLTVYSRHLSKLVEQETLERAANQFRSMCDDSYISKDRAISEIEDLHSKD